MPSPFTAKSDIVALGKLLSERRMAAGSSGNISVRLSDDTILITPTGVSKCGLAPEDLVTIDLSGKRLQGRLEPSSEKEMHTSIYRARPDIFACVHSHAPYATAFAVAGIEIDSSLLPELVLAVGSIPLIDYAPPGTGAAGALITARPESGTAFLLRNHGLVTIGTTLQQAWLRHDVVEHAAEVLHHARLLGSLNAIPDADFQRLDLLRRKLDQSWNSHS